MACSFCVPEFLGFLGFSGSRCFCILAPFGHVTAKPRPQKFWGAKKNRPKNFWTEKLSLQAPIQFDRQSPVNCCCCVSGSVSAKFHLDQRGYVPGQNILINAEVHNASNTTVTRSKVILCQVNGACVRACARARACVCVCVCVCVSVLLYVFRAWWNNHGVCRSQ